MSQREVMMEDVLAARSQMAMSLAFHIIFATVGMGMPLLIVLAEAMHMRTGDSTWKLLARQWAKGTGVLFAIGAVSGTVLSFELGLLFPRFMAVAGPIIGMPFSMEGFAFFLEAIFLGVYLYGWDRVSPRAHLGAGVGVLISGVASGAFVICANGWMNTPTGFDWNDGHPTDIDPIRAMLNPSAIPEGLHMIVGAFAAVGFLVAGLHAWALLRDRNNRFHRHAFALALLVGTAAAILQGGTGHLAAQTVSHNQPVKLAAMEAHWDTETAVGFRIGGWPDETAETTCCSVKVPYLLSLLAYDDPWSEVKGLKEFPRENRPPVTVVHVAFQIMIACGVLMMVTGGAIAAYMAWYRKIPDQAAVLWAMVAQTPLGFIAIEAGWTVTEVGRQPWIIGGLVRTRDAVTSVHGLWAHFLVFTLLYGFLGAVCVATMLRIIGHAPHLDADGKVVA
jgi:cytochrome d ubiquinol oxidase subunit I